MRDFLFAPEGERRKTMCGNFSSVYSENLFRMKLDIINFAFENVSNFVMAVARHPLVRTGASKSHPVLYSFPPSVICWVQGHWNFNQSRGFPHPKNSMEIPMTRSHSTAFFRWKCRRPLQLGNGGGAIKLMKNFLFVFSRQRYRDLFKFTLKMEVISYEYKYD